ncbi:MAG: type VI secretion system baseplate subunit TssK [Gemmataceae bacterium]
MHTLPVHWHEGMFLRPHHFQASDRFWSDQSRQVSRWDQPYNWGIRKIDIDLNALKNFRFVVSNLQARLRDGTVIRCPQDASLPECDLHERFATKNELEVFLAVPTLEVGRANVGSAADEASRYRIESPVGGVADENNGQNPRPVQFRRLNLQVLFSGDDPAGYETLPLAVLSRSTQGETTPILHRPFIPPILSCDGWPPLRADILQPIYYKIGSLVRDLGGIVRDREITFQETDPEARVMFEQVRLLNEAATVTRILARTEGVHPLVAYTELCRLIGQLAIFGVERACPDLSDYDHDNLGMCFFELKRIIDHLLNMIGAERKFQQRPFSGFGLQMRVDMEESWLAAGWQMFVGVESNLASGEVIALLTSGQMNMKIASTDRVEEVYSQGHRGMVFRYEPQPPRVLPITKKDTYFSIERSQDEWPFVLRSRRVAIRLNERLLDGDLEGKRDVMIRGQTGKQPILRFTLYVVPPKT